MLDMFLIISILQNDTFILPNIIQDIFPTWLFFSEL